jgi:hypothetical protein
MAPPVNTIAGKTCAVWHSVEVRLSDIGFTFITIRHARAGIRIWVEVFD